ATPEVLTNRGYCLQKLDQPQEARKSLDEAIDGAPDFPVAYHNRALLNLKQALAERRKSFTSAMKDIDKAIQLTTESQAHVPAILYHNAAYIYAVAARTDPSLRTTALDYLEKALDAGLDPKTITNDTLLAALKLPSIFQHVTKRSPVTSLSVE